MSSDFVKAKTLFDSNHEPCNRFGGCPYDSKIAKDSYIFFCEWCMAEMGSYGRLSKKRNINEVKKEVEEARKRFNQYIPEKGYVNWRYFAT